MWSMLLQIPQMQLPQLKETDLIWRSRGLCRENLAKQAGTENRPLSKQELSHRESNLWAMIYL